MPFIDFTTIVKEAWQDYDNTREIIRIVDISAKVSTNYVYRVTFSDGNFIIAKLSYFGKYEHFVEDHSIIDTLSNNLPAPFENFLARALAKGNFLYVYRFQNEILDAWVVFTPNLFPPKISVFRLSPTISISFFENEPN